jgi:tRNA-dihydrouridine synthase C
MRILLAPMEGLLDHSLRDAITQLGGIDACVSEFLRITDQLLPARVFTRIVPELRQGSRTDAGTPVSAQLLGSDPACLAENAARLATLGPAAIDLNFGCPAPIVNRHRGGAVLLDEPELVHAIVAAVRRAVPPAVPVTAKMRLGNGDDSRMLECAQAIASAGAAELVVHARTKVQGYRPPAHWHLIARIREAVTLPVVANGEVWTVEDWKRCCAISGSQEVMLGRGAVSDPWLARRIRGQAEPTPTPEAWLALLPFIADYWRVVQDKLMPAHAAGRLKLWLGMLRRTWPEAGELHSIIRPLRTSGEISNVLDGLSIL